MYKYNGVIINKLTITYPKKSVVEKEEYIDVIKSIEVYGEMHRYIPVIAANEGFTKIEEQVVKHQARKYGVTKFGSDRFVNGLIIFITRLLLHPQRLPFFQNV